MSFEAILTCVIFLVTIVLLVRQKISMVILGALIPAVLASFKLIKPSEAYMEFGNTTIVFFLSLCVVGEAFFKTGLADLLGEKVIGLLGKNEKGLLVGTGLVAGGLSAFMNDTGSTACLMPIVSSMAEKAHVAKSKLLMALAFFASLGGTITLAGTTPHILVNGVLADNGLREFGFFEYAKIGIPLLVMGILYMAFIGTKLLPSKDIASSGSEARAARDPQKMVTAAVIFVAVIAAMATNIVPMHVAGVFGAILVVVTGCISIQEALKSFPVSTIFIVGGVFPLSKALVSSGAAEYLVNKISPLMQHFSPLVLLIGLCLLMLVVTQFMMNSSATVLMLPIALMLCEAAGVNPLAGAMAVSISASGVFATPFGNGANMLVWEAGGYSIKDYFKVGFPMIVIYGLLTAVLCNVFYA